MPTMRHIVALVSSARSTVSRVLFVSLACSLLQAMAFGEDSPPFSKTDLSASESAGFVVDSLPIYFSSKDGAIANSKLRLARFTPENLPVSDARLVQLLADSAIKVVDYEGRALYWDFSVKLLDGHLLHVRAAANKAVGTPILSLSIHAPGSGRALEELRKKGLKFAEKIPLFLERTPTLTAHAYPRVGLLYDLSSGQRVVFDLIHLRPYPIEPSCRILRKSRCPVWSPYDRLTVKHYEALVAQFDEVSSIRKVFGLSAAATEQCVNLNLLQRKEQEYGVWCAAATGQMMLEYHGVNIAEQFDIAVKMNPPPADVFFSMATDEGEANGYGELLPPLMAVRYISPPLFGVVATEIDSQRPVRIGVHGHVRGLGCFLASGSDGSVLVYDPSTNETDPYWEDWSSLLYDDTTCSYPGECDLILIQAE